jgi:hypothetical protein
MDYRVLVNVNKFKGHNGPDPPCVTLGEEKKAGPVPVALRSLRDIGTSTFKESIME